MLNQRGAPRYAARHDAEPLKAAQGSMVLPSRARNFRIHSGWAGQAGAVTKWPSTTALESVALTSAHWAPAREPLETHREKW